MYIDSHAHLDGPRFEPDREAVLQRAHLAAVETILLIGSGTGPGTLDCAVRLAEGRSPRNPPELYATIGIHPHEAKLAQEEDFRELAGLANHQRVIGWGEIGLDYFYDYSPRDVQQRVLIRQMELARTANLPIIIHCRPSQGSDDAWEDCLGLIRAHWADSGLGGILHCFTGEMRHAQAGLEMGFLVSFAGNVTFPKAENIRQAARELPLDTMLIETDSPYLAPVPHRGKRNEPAFVIETARKIGELRGIEAEQVAAQTKQNFWKLFARSRESRVTVRRA